MSQKRGYPVLVCGQRELNFPEYGPPAHHPISAPGLVFWFADAEAASLTKYPPTFFRWINNQKEAEEAVETAQRKLAKRLAEEAEHP